MKGRPIPLTRRGRTGKRNSAGVTLLDLTLVVIIVGILAAAGVPAMITTLTDLRLAAAAEELTTAVEYAQMTAIGSNCATRVSFDTTADTVSVEKSVVVLRENVKVDSELAEAAVEVAAFQAMEHPVVRGSDYVLSLSGQTAMGSVDLCAVNLGGPSNLTFDDRGTPSAGGTVTLESDGRQLVLTVDPQSGGVSGP